MRHWPMLTVLLTLSVRVTLAGWGHSACPPSRLTSRHCTARERSVGMPGAVPRNAAQARPAGCNRRAPPAASAQQLRKSAGP